MTYQQQISITTKGHGDMHDLTEQVARVVSSSGIQTGTVNVLMLGVQAPSARLNSSRDCSMTCLPFWTSSSHPAATTATNKLGMMATATRICRPPSSDHR